MATMTADAGIVAEIILIHSFISVMGISIEYWNYSSLKVNFSCLIIFSSERMDE